MFNYNAVFQMTYNDMFEGEHNDVYCVYISNWSAIPASASVTAIYQKNYWTG